MPYVTTTFAAVAALTILSLVEPAVAEEAVTLSLEPSTPSSSSCRAALETGRILVATDSEILIFFGYHIYRISIGESGVRCVAAMLINE